MHISFFHLARCSFSVSPSLRCSSQRMRSTKRPIIYWPPPCPGVSGPATGGWRLCANDQGWPSRVMDSRLPCSTVASSKRRIHQQGPHRSRLQWSLSSPPPRHPQLISPESALSLSGHRHWPRTECFPCPCQACARYHGSSCKPLRSRAETCQVRQGLGASLSPNG